MTEDIELKTMKAIHTRMVGINKLLLKLPPEMMKRVHDWSVKKFLSMPVEEEETDNAD